jgi:hypothetical protein
MLFVAKCFNTIKVAQTLGYDISRGMSQNRSREDADNAYLQSWKVSRNEVD